MFKCEGRNKRFEDSGGFWEHMECAHGMLRQRADCEGDEGEGRGEERRGYDLYETMGRTRNGGS